MPMERLRNLKKIIVVLYRWIIYGSEGKKYHFSGKN